MEELKKLLTNVGQLLSEATSPDSPSFVGDPYASELSVIKGQVLASINSLPEPSKKSDDGATNVESIRAQVGAILNAVTVLSNVVKGRNSEKATTLASIPTKVEEAIKERTDKGELLTKETATALASAAKVEGEKEGFAKGRLLGDRRLALAGLPAEVVGTAPEETLLSEEAAFKAASDAAKARVEKLTGLGLTVASAQFRTLPWATAESFDAQFASLSEVAEAAKKATAAPKTEGPKASGLTTTTTPPTSAFRFVC